MSKGVVRIEFVGVKRGICMENKRCLHVYNIHLRIVQETGEENKIPDERWTQPYPHRSVFCQIGPTPLFGRDPLF